MVNQTPYSLKGVADLVDLADKLGVFDQDLMDLTAHFLQSLFAIDPKLLLFPLPLEYLLDHSHHFNQREHHQTLQVLDHHHFHLYT